MGQPQLGCGTSPNLSGLFPPRTGLQLGKASPLLPIPQAGSPSRLVTSRLLHAAVNVGVLSSAVAPRAHVLPPGYQPAQQTGTFVSLVVTDEAFLVLSLSSGLEHQRRWSDAFPYPLASCPFRLTAGRHYIPQSLSVPGNQ